MSIKNRKCQNSVLASHIYQKWMKKLELVQLQLLFLMNFLIDCFHPVDWICPLASALCFILIYRVYLLSFWSFQPPRQFWRLNISGLVSLTFKPFFFFFFCTNNQVMLKVTEITSHAFSDWHSRNLHNLSDHRPLLSCMNSRLYKP